MSFDDPASHDPAASPPALRQWLPVVVAVARTPRLWATALRQTVRLAPRGWWHRWPLLPLPDPDYLRFRLQTMYGGEGHSATPADVLAYLSWCKREGG